MMPAVVGELVASVSRLATKWRDQGDATAKVYGKLHDDDPLRHLLKTQCDILDCCAREVEQSLSALTAEAGKVDAISHDTAAIMLDSLDDYARMNCGVDAKGPRETLEKYISQQRLALSTATPAGEWVLVPREPTPKMIDATWNEDLDAIKHESHNTRNRRIYAAMLAASPRGASAGEG
jgi:hypothetical protein